MNYGFTEFVSILFLCHILCSPNVSNCMYPISRDEQIWQNRPINLKDQFVSVLDFFVPQMFRENQLVFCGFANLSLWHGVSIYPHRIIHYRIFVSYEAFSITLNSKIYKFNYKAQSWVMLFLIRHPSKAIFKNRFSGISTLSVLLKYF